MSLQTGQDRLLAVKVDREYDKVLELRLVTQLTQNGGLRLAGRAPRRSNLDEDRLASFLRRLKPCLVEGGFSPAWAIEVSMQPETRATTRLRRVRREDIIRQVSRMARMKCAGDNTVFYAPGRSMKIQFRFT